MITYLSCVDLVVDVWSQHWAQSRLKTGDRRWIIIVKTSIDDRFPFRTIAFSEWYSFVPSVKFCHLDPTTSSVVKFDCRKPVYRLLHKGLLDLKSSSRYQMSEHSFVSASRVKCCSAVWLLPADRRSFNSCIILASNCKCAYMGLLQIAYDCVWHLCWRHFVVLCLNLCICRTWIAVVNAVVDSWGVCYVIMTNGARVCVIPCLRSFASIL